VSPPNTAQARFSIGNAHRTLRGLHK
jgi:hypothetical protein